LKKEGQEAAEMKKGFSPQQNTLRQAAWWRQVIHVEADLVE